MLNQFWIATAEVQSMMTTGEAGHSPHWFRAQLRLSLGFLFSLTEFLWLYVAFISSSLSNITSFNTWCFLTSFLALNKKSVANLKRIIVLKLPYLGNLYFETTESVDRIQVCLNLMVLDKHGRRIVDDDRLQWLLKPSKIVVKKSFRWLCLKKHRKLRKKLENIGKHR